VKRDWRQFNEYLCSLYSSTDIIRMIKLRGMRWAIFVACMGEARNEYNILVGKPKGNRLFERSRRWWCDNVEMDVKNAVGGRGVNLSVSGYAVVMGFCEHGYEHSDSVKS
jgi:hypothetical protein